MIDKESVETFLSILGRMSAGQVRLIYGKDRPEVLMGIDLERDMKTMSEYLSHVAPQDRVRVKATGETGTVLYTLNTGANVVMDKFESLDGQVKTFDQTELERIIVQGEYF